MKLNNTEQILTIMHKKLMASLLQTLYHNQVKNQGEITQIRNKYESTQSITGNKKTVTFPNGTKIKCHYKLVEAEGGIRPNAAGEMDIFLGECESRDSVLERILKYGKNAIKKAVAEVLAMIA